MNFIKGLQKISLVDYPGKVCATIFLAKCNFKCPACYNKALVIDYEQLPEISEEEILSFLKQRKKWLDGICISGGEPLVHGNKLVNLIKKIKDIGLLVKLDTNGSYPELLKNLIEKKLIDYIAMDIKAPLEKYDKTAGIKVNKKNIEKSIEIIKNSKIEHEFRTTVTPKLLGKKDIEKIAVLLKGSKKYYLQQFRQEKNKMIDKRFESIKPYAKEKLKEMKKTAEKHVKEVGIRNV